jgi:hypothetical protein
MLRQTDSVLVKSNVLSFSIKSALLRLTEDSPRKEQSAHVLISSALWQTEDSPRNEHSARSNQLRDKGKFFSTRALLGQTKDSPMGELSALCRN